MVSFMTFEVVIQTCNGESTTKKLQLFLCFVSSRAISFPIIIKMVVVVNMLSVYCSVVSAILRCLSVEVEIYLTKTPKTGTSALIGFMIALFTMKFGSQ